MDENTITPEEAVANEEAELQLAIGQVFILHEQHRFDTRTTVRKVTIPLSDEEKIRLGDLIVAKQAKIDQIELLKKQIPMLREEISQLSGSYRNGTDIESIQCTVYYDCPAVGQKTVVRDDTREIVEISDMNDEEMQGNLPFADADVQDEPAAEPDETADTGNVYSIPENRDPVSENGSAEGDDGAEDVDAADAEMEAGYAVAAAERED